jgi:ABC-type nitrate/sulfonate/bicarbonate transport system permease component
MSAEQTVVADPEAPRAPGASARKRRSRQRSIRGVSGIIVFFALWEIAFQAGVLNPLFFGEPWAVVTSLVDLLSPGGALVPHITESAKEFGLGFGIGCLGGLVLGIILGWFRFLDDVTEPLVAAFYATPYVAFLPLVIVWVGIGMISKAVIVMWAVFFPVLINSIAGVKNTPPEFLRVADSFSVGRRRVLTTVVLPAAVPFLLAGIRQAIGRGLVGVIVAEFYLANQGVGFFIQRETSVLNANNAFAAILLIAILGIMLVRAVAVMERQVGRRWGISENR